MAGRKLLSGEIRGAWSQTAAWAKLSFGRSGPGIRAPESGIGWEAFLVAIAVPVGHTHSTQPSGSGWSSGRNRGSGAQVAAAYRSQEA